MKELHAYIEARWKEWAPRLKAWRPDRWIVAGAALLSALILIQVFRCGAAYVGAWWIARALKATAELAPKRTETKLDVYDPILSKGLLGQAQPEGGEQKADVFGILGSTALIGMSAADAKPLEVGDEVPGGEKIVNIGVEQVVLEKEGKKRTVKVFSGKPPATGGGGPPGGAPGAPPGASPPGGPATPPGASPPGGPGGPPGAGPPGAGPPGAMPPMGQPPGAPPDAQAVKSPEGVKIQMGG